MFNVSTGMNSRPQAEKKRCRTPAKREMTPPHSHAHPISNAPDIAIAKPGIARALANRSRLSNGAATPMTAGVRVPRRPRRLAVTSSSQS